MNLCDGRQNTDLGPHITGQHWLLFPLAALTHLHLSYHTGCCVTSVGYESMVDVASGVASCGGFGSTRGGASSM